MDATESVTFGATAFLVLLGVASLLGGIYLFVKALRRDRRCTASASGSIIRMVDEDFASSKKRRAEQEAKRAREEAEAVVAANEAIAAKKRAYNAKKRARAQAEADAAAATWFAVVAYAVDGATLEARATRGTTKNRYKVGQPCEVHYDPDKPAYCWLQIDGLPKTFGVILMACGVGLMLLGLVCYYILPYIANLSSGAY